MKKKVAILGCENSHADQYLKLNIKENIYADKIEFIGVYSEDEEAAKKLNREYGVNIMKNYDEFVGKVDAIMVTARHGANHFKYAYPYIPSKIPMFIDKPITTNEKEAVEFMLSAKKNGVVFTGGSSVIHADLIQNLKAKCQSDEFGNIYGGFLRAPVSLENSYGNFWFYSQHLVQMMCEIFGYYPKSVKVFKNNITLTCIVRYKDYDITIAFEDGNYIYYASVSTKNEVLGSTFQIDDLIFKREFDEFATLLENGTQRLSYSDFIASVFIINALERSMNSGSEEEVHTFEI